MNKGVAKMKLIECKYCKRTPLVTDVGGYSPYYEIYCKCGRNEVIGSGNKVRAYITWNMMQRKDEKQ